MLKLGYLHRMPNLLLYGMPGTGKTTAAFVMAREFLGDFDTNFLEINAVMKTQT